ncbi:hypothetical protein KUW15_13120 [Qipengyuania aquimaris]|uniref:hypothetical protein n=1 Tax=Qipengyuania aquimaris TaxID=255984 RepID=UPI001C97088A|nr:hypothetical protein [Qipengyuania aquimaris]MBY6129656.1 hypothetical protein [Qipengyuania aquimaris]
MILFAILVTVIAAALLLGQSRIVLRAWKKQTAGWRNPALRTDEPGRFFLNFGFEVFLMLIALWYFSGVVWSWLS